MKRRSLSASFGSWCIQLIYNPRRVAGERSREHGAAYSPVQKAQRSSDFALLLPAFLASWVTVGAGSYALCHFITLANFTSTLALVLLAAAFIALGAQCFAFPWKRLCEASRWPLVVVLILLGISTRFSNVIPVDEASESNALVAVFLCFITILSVLLAGAKSGGRIVPLSAPLVPGLSLFGLLCLISVDAEVQVCFLIFLAASIYLLSYSRFLRRIRPDLTLGTSNAPIPSAVLPLRGEVSVWWRQSLMVTSVWFVMFLVGGVVFYMPVQEFLPVLVAPQLNRVRSATQGVMLDYRGSSSIVKLQGGTYTLSDREVMRVTMHQGEPSGLWRGRVYENYGDSRWEENGDIRKIPLSSWHPRRRFSPFLNSNQWNVEPPILKPLEGSVRNLLEEVEPLEEPNGTFYASGAIVSPAIFNNRDAEANDILLPNEGNQEPRSYFVQSFVVEPNWGVLLSSPGYEPNGEHLHGYLDKNLELPQDPSLLLTLKTLANEMYSETRRPPRTPFAKVRTIANYLIQNCTYSLQSPVVPVDYDGVDFFLSESRQGACDMFASSMVLLLRQMKVPARLVTGYLLPEDSRPIGGTQLRTITLRERDAHAWVEYYVPKYGWLSYDPTAGTRTLDGALPTQLTQWLNVPVPNIPSHLLLLPAIGLGILILGVAWGRPKMQLGEAEAEEEQLRHFVEMRYARALACLRRIVPHPAHLTPGEYEARVCRAVLPADAKQEFAALTHLYIAARYGHLEPVSREQIDACLQRFEAALKKRHRVH